MSGHTECYAAEYTDVDLILPGDWAGVDVMAAGKVGLAIGHGIDDNWAVIVGTPAELLDIARRIITAVEATVTL